MLEPTSTLQEKLNQQAIHIANLEKRLEQYQLAYDQLQQQLTELLRHRFGQRSERYIDPNDPQYLLFPHLATTHKDQSQEQTTTVTAHQRQKKRQRSTANIPRQVTIIPVEANARHCACGCEKQVIRYETKELHDYQPATFQIIEQRREVVACPKGCTGSIKTAPAPLQVLPKIKATESLLAHIVVSKCHHRQPLYHLEKYGEAVGISRETMARWFIQLCDPLMPLWNLLKDSVIDYDIAGIDATSLQVLKEPGRKATTKSYVYCLRGGTPATAVVLYGYNHAQHKIFVDNWLEGFKGRIHLDADPFFETLLHDKEVHPSFCHAHARRYFEKVKQQAKKQGLAHQALRYYKKLYAIERRAKEQKLTTDERLGLRQADTQPIYEEFKAWLDQHAPTTLAQSPLGKAFRYALNHWDGLSEFLKDGRLEIDNNLTEQEIKPFVIARKNFLFANSMEGARALCLHFSLIRTALLHKLNPHQYYVAVLKQIPDCQTVEDYEKLLPWRIQLE